MIKTENNNTKYIKLPMSPDETLNPIFSNNTASKQAKNLLYQRNNIIFLSIKYVYNKF
jgi:hypothetical protein